MPALAGAPKAAMEAWWDVPADGAMLDDAIRVPGKAGAVAAGLPVSVANALSPDRATFEEDVRDFCADCGVAVRSLQNMLRDHLRARHASAGTPSNVASQVNLLVRAGTTAGEDAATTEAKVRTALAAAAMTAADLSGTKYQVALHMLQWQEGVVLGNGESVMTSKVYRHHVSAGGETLKGEMEKGEASFRRFMASQRREAEARGETAYRLALDKLVAPLDDQCHGNWEFFSSYMQMWIKRHMSDGLKTPYDEPLLDFVEKKRRAESFGKGTDSPGRNTFTSISNELVMMEVAALKKSLEQSVKPFQPLLPAAPPTAAPEEAIAISAQRR